MTMSLQSLAPEHLVLLQQDANQRTGVESGEWVVVQEQQTQWTDTSLGVREPGRMYGKVMIPGVRIVLRDGHDGNRELTYHVGFGGSFVFAGESRRLPQRSGVALG